jgi:aspartate/methionine/tyrosine aminotransferase
MANPYLKPLYRRENALQAINATAAAIERESRVAVIRAHLGNPLGPQHEKSNHVVADYYRQRSLSITNRGYADVIGPPPIRHVIANALTRLNRLKPGLITKDNIRGVNGGTGALNLAISIFNEPIVVVSDPYYPSWLDIADHLGVRIETYPLREEDDYLINAPTLELRIAEIDKYKGNRPLILIYHYPNNPTGKTLTYEEAKATAECLNYMCARYPHLYLVQEDLYLATTACELGIYTPLSYLDANTRRRTMWLVSPSKMGHAQDRGAVIAAFNSDLLLHLRGALSFDMLGPSHPSLLITANTLCEIASGGLEPIDSVDASATNFRYKLAAYYQDRIKIVAEGLRNIDKAIASSILPGSTPKGAYYLYVSLQCLLGKPVPAEFGTLFNKDASFANANDVCLALCHAHLIGLQPVTVASGVLFTNDPKTMRIRISTVEPNIGQMRGIIGTIGGLIQRVLGVSLGASFHSIDCLRKRHPVDLHADAAVPLKFDDGTAEHSGFVVRC